MKALVFLTIVASLLVSCQAPSPQPLATLVPANTPVPPTSTPVPPTSTSTPTSTPVPPSPTPRPMLAATPNEPVTLKLFSPWSWGNDAFALNTVLGRFRQQHDYINSIDISNEQSAAESGIRSGRPPDLFFTDMGHEALNKWVSAGKMEQLDDVYTYYSLNQAFPQGVISLASSDNHMWAIPASIGRSNVLWYNQSIFDANGLKPEDLQTFAGWEAAAQKLQGAGITPLALGNKDSWVTGQLFENVLLGTLGPDKYAGLWDGTTDWKGEDVTQALNNFETMLKYANPDHDGLGWEQAYQKLIERRAAMYVMGSWMVGAFSDNGFEGYGWTTFPGTAGTFVAWPDGFSLPKGTKNPDVAKELLAYIASQEGQQALNGNRRNGALCARIDCDYSGLSPYYQAAAADLQADTIVPSMVRESFSETWTTGFMKAITRFLSTHNVEAAQSELANACKGAKICK